MLSSDLLHGLFERWVPSLREQVAVVDDESSITFGELERRSNQLAHRLVRAGVGPDRCVVLMLERSAEMVVAILGTLKAGGAYVPLEPNLPRTRAEAIISDCRASCVVAAASLFASHGAPPAPVIELDHPGLASELPTPPPKGAYPANLAYVIFT